jgi:glycosyltransferase involved in cell wall biosynthesis
MTSEPSPTSKLPFVSVVIPALNAARTLDECLASIRAQDYSHDRIEIIIADAGSTDGTLEIAREHDVETITDNPLKTGEAGKSAAIEKARGEIIALIDSDNILPDENWLRVMTAPFHDPEIIGSEPLEYTRRASDPALTRYFAMLGMNDPVCLFLGNYDRHSDVTGQWTGLAVDESDEGGYLKLCLSLDALPTIGANGFMIRRSVLEHVNWSPYFFDIDVLAEAIHAGHRHVAKVKTGIVHLYCSTLRDFARKQDRRVRDFLHFSQERERSYPWKQQSRAGILTFCLCTVLVIPLLIQMIRGASRRRDWAWLYHVPACWITLGVYGWNAIAKTIGMQRGPKSREGWTQA